MLTSVTNADVDWNDLQATITPRSVDSKILITVVFGAGTSSPNGGVYLKRNSTKIGGTGLTSVYSHPDNIWNTDEFLLGANFIIPIVIKYLDSPSSIAPLTYKIGYRSASGSSNNFYFNRASGSTDYGNYRATITLEEIL